jgi:hypothetical protein
VEPAAVRDLEQALALRTTVERARELDLAVDALDHHVLGLAVGRSPPRARARADRTRTDSSGQPYRRA